METIKTFNQFCKICKFIYYKIVFYFYNNLLKRVTKMSMLHFLDTGLCAHLLKWGNPEALERNK
ncbi:DUF4143 domain-containing protein [Desulfosporosinus sp. OT]|uniref:DUF4143 domain-containing protein n=1 Tax=Desulfosporosinus sp. OT TaxID=913865 RepID=UPI000223A624|nr:hypothetical protein DOT_3700 [Desulfosporosinus sp. OT]